MIESSVYSRPRLPAACMALQASSSAAPMPGMRYYVAAVLLLSSCGSASLLLASSLLLLGFSRSSAGLRLCWYYSLSSFCLALLLGRSCVLLSSRQARLPVYWVGPSKVALAVRT